MSGEGAPDLAQALVGFRAWRPDREGRLHPWSLTAAGPWDPGVNTARCAMHLWHPRIATKPHRAPATHCMCGIYGLASSQDRRLHGRDGQVVGAIAAWGDIELHRTGFRAEHAAIVALVGDARAAARYGVELVAREALAEAALRFGAPVDVELLRGVEEHQAVLVARHVGETGIAMDRHVQARPLDAFVETGPTPALRALLADDPDVTLPPVGTQVVAGDVLGVATGRDGRAYLVWCLVSGRLAATDPSMRDGWLARVDDTDWPTDQRAFTWGRAAEVHYAAEVALQRTGRDVFGDVLHEQHLTAPVRSAADVLRELDRRRRPPAYETAAELYAACAPRVGERIAADPDAARRAARAEVTLRVRTREPAAELWLDARDGGVRVRCGAAPGRTPDLTLDTDAASAVRLFGGRLDVARALHARTVVSDAGAPRTLGVLSVLKPVL